MYYTDDEGWTNRITGPWYRRIWDGIKEVYHRNTRRIPRAPISTTIIETDDHMDISLPLLPELGDEVRIATDNDDYIMGIRSDRPISGARRIQELLRVRRNVSVRIIYTGSRWQVVGGSDVDTYMNDIEDDYVRPRSEMSDEDLYLERLGVSV